ncbi:MAG: transporter [Ignavibacteria bacterium]
MASALFISKNLYSQACCTSGSTFLGGLERGGINYSSLSFSIGYEFNNLNSSYNGTTKIDDPFQRNADVQNITLGIEYGLTERMSVLVIPTLLVTKNREITVKDSANMSQKKKFTGTGFGDIILFGKYRLTNRSVFTTFELDLGLGVKLPTGSFTKEDNGTRIPIDLQPGNGAIELINSLYFIKQFPKLKLNLYGNVSYRYIGANFDGYKVGDELFASAFVNYGLLKFLNPSVGLRSRYAKRDFAEGRLLPSTGSYSVFVIPGITYSEGPLNINVYYQIPLHRNIRGIQLTVSEVIGAEVQYIIFTQPP